MRRHCFGLAVLACALCGGCTQSRMGISPPPAYLFCYYKAPMSFRAAEDAPGVPSPPDLLTGTGSASNLIVPRTQDLVSWGWGDVTLDEAARKAGIRQISYADYSRLSVLGIFNRVRISVRGR